MHSLMVSMGFNWWPFFFFLEKWQGKMKIMRNKIVLNVVTPVNQSLFGVDWPIAIYTKLTANSIIRTCVFNLVFRTQIFNLLLQRYRVCLKLFPFDIFRETFEFKSEATNFSFQLNEFLDLHSDEQNAIHETFFFKIQTHKKYFFTKI